MFMNIKRKKDKNQSNMIDILQMLGITGVMMGYETSITLQTPCEVLQANAGFKREVTVNKTECDEIVDDVVWGVDSQIKVG